MTMNLVPALLIALVSAPGTAQGNTSIEGMWSFHTASRDKDVDACVLRPKPDRLFIFRILDAGGGSPCKLEQGYVMQIHGPKLQGKLFASLFQCRNSTNGFLFLRDARGTLSKDGELSLDGYELTKAGAGPAGDDLCNQAEKALHSIEAPAGPNPLQAKRDENIGRLVKEYEKYLASKQPAQALLKLMAAMKIDGFRIDLLYPMAELSSRLRKYDLALLALRRLMLYDPMNRWAEKLSRALLAGSSEQGGEP